MIQTHKLFKLFKRWLSNFTLCSEPLPHVHIHRNCCQAAGSHQSLHITKNHTTTMKKSSDPRVATLAGAIGGGLEASFTWPTEFAKTQMQLQKVTASGEVLPAPGHPRVYKNAIDCGRSVIKRQVCALRHSSLGALPHPAIPLTAT